MSDAETNQDETPETEGQDAPAPVPQSTVIVVPAGGLMFVNPEGRPLLGICEMPEGAAMEIYNASGLCVACMMTSADGGGWVAVQHPGGPAAAAMMTFPDAGYFARFDPQGAVVTDPAPDPMDIDPALLPWPPSGGHHLN